MGPCGLIAIKEGYRPTWVRTSFDSGQVDADDPSDDEVKEIIKLIEDGHAKVLSNVGHMHVSTKVTASILGDTVSDESDESDEDGDKGGNGVESPEKESAEAVDGEVARKRVKV